MKNRRKQSKHMAFKLLIDGREYGCYEDMLTARSIGRSMVNNGNACIYSVYDDNDNLVDQD